MTDNDELNEMLEHHRIRKVLVEYCRGSDRADEPLMASIYAEDSWDDHGVVRAPGPEYSKLMCERVRETTDSLSHLLGQSAISLNGEEAGAETYFVAVALDTAEDGTTMCNQLGGRFVDQLVRENGKWKVKHRRAVRDWSVAIPLHHDWALSHTLAAGQRSNEDPSYAVLGTTHGAGFAA
jgi:hypothetical protein